MVAHANAGHRAANVDDDPDAFVAEDPAGRYTGYVTLQDMQVGATNRGGCDTDNRVSGLSDCRLGSFFPGPLSWAFIDEAFHPS